MMISNSVLKFNLLLKISTGNNTDTFFTKALKTAASLLHIENIDTTLFDIHTKGSGFTFKITFIIFLVTIVLYFLNVYSRKVFISNKQTFFFNPFVLWVLAWVIDILILLIRYFIFEDKYLDLQFLFVPSLIVWILFKIFFLGKKKKEQIDVSFLEDWIHYQTKFWPVKYFFNKISRNKEKNKSLLFYWSIQIFILDCFICTIRILIYGCLILGRLDFTISFIIFLTMIYIYRKKLN